MPDAASSRPSSVWTTNALPVCWIVSTRVSTLDLDVELGGVPFEVIAHLVATWVAIGLAGKRQPRHRAVRRRREHAQAVVVAGPRSGGTIAGLEDHRRHPQVAEQRARQPPSPRTPVYSSDHHGGNRPFPVRLQLWMHVYSRAAKLADHPRHYPWNARYVIIWAHALLSR